MDETASWRDKHDAAAQSLARARTAVAACQKSSAALQAKKNELKVQLKDVQAELAAAQDAAQEAAQAAAQERSTAAGAREEREPAAPVGGQLGAQEEERAAQAEAQAPGAGPEQVGADRDGEDARAPPPLDDGANETQ